MSVTELRHGRYKWAVVAMLWSICLFNYADRQAIFSVFPLLEKEFHLGPVELGLLGSAFAWVYGLGGPLAGLIVDRVKRRSAILTGLHVWSIICVLTALSRNFTHLMFFRAAEGAGETFYYPASVSMLSDYHGKATRSRALGFLQTSVYMGTIGGGFFAGLIGQRYGWRSSFVVFGGLGILLGFVLRKYLREPVRGMSDDAPAQQRIPVGEAFRLILSNRSVLCLMGAFVCANFVAVVLLAWMPKFLYERFGMSLAAAGLAATVYAQLAGMAGASIGGWLADTLARHTPRGRVMVQASAVFAAAPFVLLCGLAPSLTLVIVALTGWGFCKGFYDANIFASPFDVIPAQARGTVAGLMNCVGWFAGGGTAPLIVGLVARQHGLGFAIAAASGVYVLAGLLLATCLLFLPRRHPAAVRTA